MKFDLKNYRPFKDNPRYLVGNNGLIYKKDGLHILGQTCTNGYYHVNLEIGKEKTNSNRRKNINGEMVTIKERSIFKYLPVHRIVAQTWVENPEPEVKVFVNHKDGNTMNNNPNNLEWCTCKENNQHAFENKLVDTSESCRVRNFETGEVTEFGSIADAKRFMGVPINTVTSQLYPSRFGVLLRGKYEFRLKSDKEPWFYENRTRKVSSIYVIKIENEQGDVVECFGIDDLVKRFDKLKERKFKNPYEAVKFIRGLNPSLKIEILDSRLNDKYAKIRSYLKKRSYYIWVYNLDTKEEKVFPNTTAASELVGCHRKTINKERLTKSLIPWKGVWLFAKDSDKERIEFIKLINNDRAVNKPF